MKKVIYAAVLIAGLLIALLVVPSLAVQTTKLIDQVQSLVVSGATATTPAMFNGSKSLVSARAYMRAATSAACAAICSPGICLAGQVASTALLAACSTAITGSCLCLEPPGQSDDDDNNDNDNNDDNDVSPQ